MKKFELKNKAFKVAIALLTLSTLSIEAARRPPTNAGVQQVITPLPEGIQAIITVKLAELIAYTDKVHKRTDLFFSNKTEYAQDLQDFNNLTKEIETIKNGIYPHEHVILGSLHGLAQKLYEAQKKWTESIAARNIGTMAQKAGEIAKRNLWMLDNIYGAANGNKRSNGIKQRLLASGAAKEVALLKQLIQNIDSVFNYDGTPHGVGSSWSKANYLRTKKGFTFNITLPPMSPIKLMAEWDKHN